MATGRRPGRGKSLKIPAASVALSLIVAYLLVAPVLGKIIAGRGVVPAERSLAGASVIDFGNYEYPRDLGIYRLFSADGEGAVVYFRKALRLYPLHLYTWFNLARTYYSMEEKEKARLLLEAVLKANRINRNLAWDAGVFLLARGELRRGAMFLGRYIDLDPGGYARVFDLLYRFGMTTEEMMSTLLERRPEAYGPFLRYLIRRKRLDDIQRAWQGLPHDQISDAEKIDLCNVFIRNGRYGFAQRVWDELRYDQRDTGIIHNGDFEQGLRKGCFGWVTGRAEGVRVYLQEEVSFSGRRAVAVSFDGEHNPGITLLRQVVPVEEGSSYLFTGYIRTEGITTTNGLFYELTGYRCRGPALRSAVFTGTNPWTEIRMEFTVPEGCEALLLSVKRARSRKFNNKIKGEAWVDSTALVKGTTSGSDS